MTKSSTGQSEAEAAFRGALQAAARLGAGHRRPGQEQWVNYNHYFKYQLIIIMIF